MSAPTDPAWASRPAYRVRSDAVWAQAREAYLSGMNGPDVCSRFGLGLAALRARAQLEGWRRLDRPPCEPDPDLGPEFDRDRPGATAGQMAAFAWSHASRAAVEGRCGEAWRWTRLYELYRAMAIDDGVTGWSPSNDCFEAAAERSAGPAPASAPDREPTRREEEDDFEDEFDSFDSFDSFFPADEFAAEPPEPPLALNRAARREAAAKARKANGGDPPAGSAARSRDSLVPA